MRPSDRWAGHREETEHIIAISWFYPFRSETTVSSPFGPRASPGGIGSTNHQGIDYAPGQNTPIYAVAAGTVTASGLIGGYGNHVVIAHGEGWTSLYGHMASASPLRVGQSVGAGSYVGPVGMTGNSTGPHLHLQLELDGVPRDPAPLIRADALAPNPPRYPTTPPVKKEKDMFVLKTIGNLNEVPSGYTALVGIRTLRHLDADQVTLIRAAGVDYYERTPADFYKTISALGIPRAALVVNADYAREYTD